MKEQINIENHGLKCDEPTCDYVYAFVEGDTYEKYVNAPCPKCGSNLLTQEDCDTMMEVLALIEMANSPDFVAPILPMELQELVDQLEDPEKKAKMKIDFVDGLPVMSSDDAEIQGIIDAIDAYYKSDQEPVAHIDSLENK